MSLLRDSAQAFLYVERQRGWQAALRQAGQFLRAPLHEYHDSYMLRKSLVEPVLVPMPEVPVSIKQVDLGNEALLETIMPPLRVKRLAKKLEAGETCCAAVRDGNVVAYVLAGFANTPSTKDTRLELTPKEAYLWAGYALPQFRRQGVVKAVNLTLCRLLQERGYESVILLVDQHNRASLGHCYKMGYRITGRRIYLRLLKWARCQYTPIEEPGISGP